MLVGYGLLFPETVGITAACSGRPSSRTASRTVRSLPNLWEEDSDAASSVRIVDDVIPPGLPATIELRNGCDSPEGT